MGLKKNVFKIILKNPLNERFLWISTNQTFLDNSLFSIEKKYGIKTNVGLTDMKLE